MRCDGTRWYHPGLAPHTSGTSPPTPHLPRLTFQRHLRRDLLERHSLTNAERELMVMWNTWVWRSGGDECMARRPCRHMTSLSRSRSRSCLMYLYNFTSHVTHVLSTLRFTHKTPVFSDYIMPTRYGLVSHARRPPPWLALLETNAPPPYAHSLPSLLTFPH